MIDKVILDQIRDIVKAFPEDILADINGVGIEGSSSLPFINNFHDLDIYIYYPHKYYTPKSPREEAITHYKQMDKIKEIFNEKLKINYRIDIHFVSDKKLLSVIDYAEWKSTRRDIFLNLYQHVYTILIYTKPEFNYYPDKVIEFFKTMDKKLYLECLQRWMNIDCKRIAFNERLNPNHRTKRLYHVLISLYILENNSFTDFTEEQIKNINIAHDCSDGYEELFEYTENRISELLNTLQ